MDGDGPNRVVDARVSSEDRGDILEEDKDLLLCGHRYILAHVYPEDRKGGVLRIRLVLEFVCKIYNV